MNLLFTLEGLKQDEAEALDRLCVLYQQGMIDSTMLAEHLGRATMLNEIVRLVEVQPNEEY